MAERRVELANETLRLDFDPRTSDTMYNYLHIRRPDTGRWERLHNFGIDLRGRLPEKKDPLNSIGLCLDLRQEGRTMHVGYPAPLIPYRQFDDKVGSADTIRRYPDITREQMRDLVHVEGSATFSYDLDPDRPSFLMSGRLLSGTVDDITYIISALWTDNHVLPTHQYIESFPEYDTRHPDAAAVRHCAIENVAFVLFYRHDGQGLPFAMLPQEPQRAEFTNFFDNAKCLADFRTASLQQRYIPQDPAVKDCNDVGYVARPGADGRFPAVRVAFFPELGWGQGGTGRKLRDALVAAIQDRYWDAAGSWRRVEKWLPPRLTLTGRFDR